MKNLKARMKNPAFWLAFVPVLVSLIYAVLAIFSIVPSVTESEIINIATLIISLFTISGILVSPTGSKKAGTANDFLFDGAETYEEETAEATEKTQEEIETNKK